MTRATKGTKKKKKKYWLGTKILDAIDKNKVSECKEQSKDDTNLHVKFLSSTAVDHENAA